MATVAQNEFKPQASGYQAASVVDLSHTGLYNGPIN